MAKATWSKGNRMVIMFRFSTAFLGLIFCVIFASAQRAVLPITDTLAGSLNERIRTLRCQLNDDPYAPPVLVIGSNDILTFSFDHLSEDWAFFRYRLTHCNANWQPSGLVDSEIVDGFNEGTVDDYAFSRGTTVNYVNYRFSIPNKDIAPLLSGNYLVTLYEEGNPDEPVAQWRFMVSEHNARIGIELTTRTDVDYNVGHQQLSIIVDTERDNVVDPFNDLTVMIQQNNRLDNEAVLRQPLRMSGRKAIYEHLTPLIFEAGNEYRRFESVTLDYPGMNVENIQYIDPYYHVTLYADNPRAESSYLFDQTQLGRYMIREWDSDEGDTMADYVVVHFTLEMDEMPGTMIFIDGDLTDRRFDGNSRMQYNPVLGRYEKAMLLKQGSYNYNYLAVPPGKTRGYNIIDGDKYQTVNEYLIKVYTRQPGDRYDHLIGVSRIVNN